MCYQMHNMGIAFDLHQFAHRHCARLTDSPDIIPPQIYQHDVLGAFFFIIAQLFFQRRVFFGGFTPRPGTGERAGHNIAVLNPDQHLR